MAHIEHREHVDGVLQAPYDPVTAVRGITVVDGNLVLDCYDEVEQSWQSTIVLSVDEQRLIHEHLGWGLMDEATSG